MFMRPLVSLLCAALLAATLLGPAQGAEAVKRVKKPRAKPHLSAAELLAKPRLSQTDLAAPYSALNRDAAAKAEARERGGERADLRDSYQSNATSWKLDLSLTPKRTGEDDALRLKLGREKVLDPVTNKELTPRADPLKARQSLEDLNLKGALESVGGKAEVQVDILKF